MTQSTKRPGAKDISELKARLGLKKAGPAAAKGPAGMVAPPGARAGGVIPAPPGAQPPRPQIPDAKEDPFGAMNAIAAHGAQAAQPQIVVVNDGTPVEQVQGKARAKIAVLAAVGVVALVFGIAVGKISSGAKNYNRTIDDAAKIRDDVKKVRDGLIGIQQTLANAKLRTNGKYVPGDSKLLAELEALPALQPNIDVVFDSFMYDLQPELVAAILSFYVQTIELNELIKNHIQLSKDGAKALTDAQKKMQGFNPLGYAALLEMPVEGAQGLEQFARLKLVQISAPVCDGETSPSETGCAGKKISGFRYRPDELGPWGVKKVASAEDGAVAADGIVVLDPSSAVLKQIIKGGEPTIAEVGYLDRMKKIDQRVTELIDSQKAIESRLNAKANEGHKFTFFM